MLKRTFFLFSLLILFPSFFVLAQVSMRGFGENSFGRVVVLVDGKKLNTPDMQGLNWLSVPLSSIDRIEILDGPSAVLYGSGAVGGVINIITKKAVKVFGVSLIASGGSFWTNRTQFNLGFSGETGGLSVSVDQYNTDGYRERSGSRSTNATVNGYRDFGGNATLSSNFSFSNIFYEMPGSLSKAQFEADPRQAVNQNDEGREKDIGGALSYEWHASDALSLVFPVDYTFRNIETDTASWPSYVTRYAQQGGFRPKATFNGSFSGIPVNLVGGADLETATLDVHSYSDKQRTAVTNSFTIQQISGGPYLTARATLPFAVTWFDAISRLCL
jgi:iron complex outermembrane receptor protein